MKVKEANDRYRVDVVIQIKLNLNIFDSDIIEELLPELLKGLKKINDKILSDKICKTYLDRLKRECEYKKIRRGQVGGQEENRKNVKTAAHMLVTGKPTGSYA